MKKIVLCADDYGQNPEVSSGIRQLIANKRLSATSCMVNTEHWSEQGQALLSHQDKIDIGWHINLTEGQAISKQNKNLPSLKQLILRCFTKKYSIKTIEDELSAQLDRFITVVGKSPDFIDGHQHIHHLPIVRQALLNCYQKNKLTIPVRSVAVQSWQHVIGKNFMKRSIIHFTGAGALQKLLKKHNIPYNPYFSGVYNFAYAKDYPKLFQQFLRSANDNTLIMCHPGTQPKSLNNDVIANSRGHELSYLNSQQFVEDCLRLNIQLHRFQDII